MLAGQSSDRLLFGSVGRSVLWPEFYSEILAVRVTECLANILKAESIRYFSLFEFRPSRAERLFLNGSQFLDAFFGNFQ